MRDKVKKKDLPRCKACGKILRDAESIRLGYGLKCYQKVMNIEKKRQNFLNIHVNTGDKDE